MSDVRIQDALRRIEARQEATIVGISGMADVLEIHTDMLQLVVEEQKELKGWLQDPPKSDLPDLLKRLTTAIELMQAQIVALPAAVARAVVDGDLGGRG